jgi:DNA-binding transcriptional ArsR family regulator
MKVTAQILNDFEPSEFAAAAATLKLLADPTRLHVVWALLREECSVGQLATHIGVTPAAISQHLAKLRLAGLVVTRRAGNHIYYAAGSHHLLRLVTEALFHADHAVSEIPAHHRGNGRPR